MLIAPENLVFQNCYIGSKMKKFVALNDKKEFFHKMNLRKNHFSALFVLKMNRKRLHFWVI